MFLIVRVFVLFIFFVIILYEVYGFMSELRGELHHYNEIIMKTYPKDIYIMGWNNFIRMSDLTQGKVKPDNILSGHVAYSVFGDKLRNIFSRFFYEKYIQITLSKKEKLNIYFSTKIYSNGIQGIDAASVFFFKKKLGKLSKDELILLFKK